MLKYHEHLKTGSLFLCDPAGRKNLAGGDNHRIMVGPMCAPAERENGAHQHRVLLLAPLQGAKPLFVVLLVVATTG